VSLALTETGTLMSRTETSPSTITTKATSTEGESVSASATSGAPRLQSGMASGRKPRAACFPTADIFTWILSVTILFVGIF